jgi:GNAT superfamily N-acetyltransferase
MAAELSHRYEDSDDGTFGFRPEHLTGPRCAFLIGRVDGRAAACGGLRPREDNVAEFKRMYVAPGYRGRGYSKAMLRALESTARANGYEKVWLETGDRQPEAIRLYESSGYRQIASEPTLAFEKDLPTEPT